MICIVVSDQFQLRLMLAVMSVSCVLTPRLALEKAYSVRVRTGLLVGVRPGTEIIAINDNPVTRNTRVHTHRHRGPWRLASTETDRLIPPLD